MITSSKNAVDASDGSRLRRLVVLLVTGFFIFLFGIIISVAATMLSGGGTTSYGLVIFVGPFPIIIGVGSEAKWLIVFATILTILSIALFLLTRKRTEKADD